MRRMLPLLLAAAAFLAFAILWIVSDQRASQRVFDDYSSANTSPKGLSLASGYLARYRKAGILTRPLGREPLEPNAVVFRVTGEFATFFDPEQLDEEEAGPPKPKLLPLLDDRAEAFVRRGGRLVIAAREGHLVTTPVADATRARKVLPLWPGVSEVKLFGDTHAFVELPARMLPVFLTKQHAIVARQRIGSGDVIVLSTPELLANEHLTQNLALLVALAGERRPIYFDEVLHGITTGDGALTLLQEWNLGPFLLLLGLIALLVFWRSGRRIGPAEEEWRDVRSDAVDLVRSIGALYAEVTTESEALALYRDALTRTVAHHTGLRGDALHKRVDDLTRGRTDLDSLNHAFRQLGHQEK